MVVVLWTAAGRGGAGVDLFVTRYACTRKVMAAVDISVLLPVFLSPTIAANVSYYYALSCLPFHLLRLFLLYWLPVDVWMFIARCQFLNVDCMAVGGWVAGLVEMDGLVGLQWSVCTSVALQ